MSISLRKLKSLAKSKDIKLDVEKGVHWSICVRVKVLFPCGDEWDSGLIDPADTIDLWAELYREFEKYDPEKGFV